MWYRTRKVFAAGLDETLDGFAAQGADPQVVEHVRSQTPQEMPQYINQLRSNPAHTMDSLQQAMQQQQQQPQRQVYQATPLEQSAVSGYHPEFQKWSLAQLRKMRQPGNTQNNGFGYRGLAADDKGNYGAAARGTFGQLHDWYRSHVQDNPQFKLPSVNLAQATARSAEWHRAVAGHGRGKEYLPYTRGDDGEVNDPRIVHKFDDGYFMVNVDNPNDLTVEGNRMRHCVGTYCDDVEQKLSRIYSLRDPQNQPHATIEMDGTGNKVKQIKGHGDGVPEYEHKGMVKEWLNTLPDARWKNGNSDYDDDEVYWGHDTDEIAHAIYEEVHGIEQDDFDDNDYGLPNGRKERDITNFYMPGLYDDVISHMGKSYDYSGKYTQIVQSDAWPEDGDQIGEALSSVAVASDKARLRQLVEEGVQMPFKNWVSNESKVAYFAEIKGVHEKEFAEEEELEPEKAQIALREKKNTHVPYALDASIQRHLSEDADPEYIQLVKQVTGHDLEPFLTPDQEHIAQEQEHEQTIKDDRANRDYQHAQNRLQQPGLFDHTDDIHGTQPPPSKVENNWAYASIRRPRR